ncbi:hypothetical protein BDP27DRAFT_1368665 [Rhodocollybia butyracea]|uniref:Uncharacterized protein n=1 Tax=Rhodocollybia butyracea TaxID=206335 RepID=A0A9P5PF35_9AGAR|nr:hypothetical protein BDP27DRAFT_1368665 [Rhodocollybia butyracea]
MSNTARINRIAASRAGRSRGLSTQDSILTSRRRIRGPAHGLQGSAREQRNSRSSRPRILQGSDIRRLERQGDIAQAESHVLSTPDVILQQTFGTGHHNYDMPMGQDFGDSRPGGVSDDDEGWEDEVMTQAEQLREAMSEQGGKKSGHRDYRTRRDRTDLTWKNFEQQKAPMVQAFMAWQYDPNPANSNAGTSTIGVTAIDIFGAF